MMGAGPAPLPSTRQKPILAGCLGRRAREGQIEVASSPFGLGIVAARRFSSTVTHAVALGGSSSAKRGHCRRRRESEFSVALALVQ